MSLSILYCGQCARILAASPDLSLAAECVSHSAGSVTHRGYVALRLPDVDVTAAELTDLDVLAVKYPKADAVRPFEPLAGDCP